MDLLHGGGRPPATLPSMSVYVVTYRYAADESRLARVRPARYTFFDRLTADGALLASGQLLDGPLGDGMLVLEAADRASAERLLDDDPFVHGGLVAERIIAPWRPTAGAWVAAS